MSEDIPRADKIGIAAVIAANASEHLFHAVAPVLRTTFGTDAGRASRIDGDKPHTVILRQLLDPLTHAPVCPRSGGFAETLAGPALAPGTGAATHTIADRPEIVTEDLAVAGRRQFGNTDVDTERVAVFAQSGFGKLDPDDKMISGESAPLHQPRPRQCRPFVEHKSAPGREGDALALAQRRQTHNQIEAAAAILDTNTMAEDRCTFEDRALCLGTRCGSCFLCAVDDGQRLFESLVLMEGLQPGTLIGKPAEGLAVEPAGCCPQRADIEIDRTAIDFEQRGDLMPLSGGHKIKRDLAGSREHGSSRGDHTLSLRYLRNDSVVIETNTPGKQVLIMALMGFRDVF
jgi:hypothetical protein